MDDLQENLLETAREMGAVDAVLFSLEDIVFDDRTILKCMFGCADWGRGLTCPSRPGSLKPWEYRRVLENYSWGVMIHTHDKRRSQEISFELERVAFLAQRHFAFSLSDCALCSECAGNRGQECRHPRKARPAFHSVGIDVFRTVRKFELPLRTLRDEDQQQNWYSAVFVE